MKETNEVLTSVYVNKNLNDCFKLHKVIHKISLRQIVETAIYKFLTDDNFRIMVQTTQLPETYAVSIKVEDNSTMPLPPQVRENVKNLDPTFLTQPFPAAK